CSWPSPWPADGGPGNRGPPKQCRPAARWPPRPAPAICDSSAGSWKPLSLHVSVGVQDVARHGRAGRVVERIKIVEDADRAAAVAGGGADLLQAQVGQPRSVVLVTGAFDGEILRVGGATEYGPVVLGESGEEVG